ncbi:UNVERIFIED_CONTAM: Mitochondrial RNA-splicing protein MRS3 [Sesamum angustifolium]|uniref:Mitochondrial RNA-splicing protein MRS3 n=1 Tax=Sesamum angustifolium TaxID=2727405 RepID=A0AAW2QSD9_9LAMI
MAITLLTITQILNPSSFPIFHGNRRLPEIQKTGADSGAAATRVPPGYCRGGARRTSLLAIHGHQWLSTWNFPLTLSKTQMQALGSCPIKSASVKQALGSILRSDGPKGLYRGIGAMGLGAGPAHAVYFSVYEFCKKSFSGGIPIIMRPMLLLGFAPRLPVMRCLPDGYGEAETAIG